MANYQVTLIGAVGSVTTYDEHAIVRLLNTQQTLMFHGDTFTGKPTTKIYIDADNVLKIHEEIRLELRDALRWATQALVKEVNYQVYHPQKTWFVVESDSSPSVLVGNVCPRLRPLHELLNASEIDISTRLDYFQQLFHHYFRLAATLKIRLDEGLSNFGVTPTGELYYLDDDVYIWDRYMSCAHMLGVYFRGLLWLNPQIATQLGHIVRQQILKHFGDAQYLAVLAEQLKGIFMPNKRQLQILDNFINALPLKQQPSNRIGSSKDRYLALLGDVHGNLPALEAVLAFLATENIQQGLVLGDSVGYGPHPSECITRLADTRFVILKGNHDHALATNNFKVGFSKSAAWALTWSLPRVNAEQREWLSDLPPVVYAENWMAVHGSPLDPTFFNAYVYEMTYHDNLGVLEHKKIPICFHGHTHQPGVYGRRGISHILDGFYTGKEITLDQFSHALVCPGSVGQPRNGQIGAQLAIYDQVERKVSYHNLPYNFEVTVREMQIQGFPESLIKMLTGRT